MTRSSHNIELQFDLGIEKKSRQLRKERRRRLELSEEMMNIIVKQFATPDLNQ